MFLFLSFLIFTGALGAAAYYVWYVPREHAQDLLGARLRELRVSGGARIRAATDLVRREQRGSLAFLGDFVSWLGILRRLQLYIDQANLKYRAAEVFALCVIIAVTVYVLLGFAGLSLLILRVGLALGLGVLPVVYISRIRSRRLHKFEEMLPDAIDLFNRSMKSRTQYPCGSGDDRAGDVRTLSAWNSARSSRNWLWARSSIKRCIVSATASPSSI